MTNWLKKNKSWFWGVIVTLLGTIIASLQYFYNINQNNTNPPTAVKVNIIGNNVIDQSNFDITDNQIISYENSKFVKKKENKSSGGVSIGGNVEVHGNSYITGNGDINITKEVSSTSDRIVSIQKRLSNLHSQDPVIIYLIQKAKDAFYANKLDEAEKIIKEIEFKRTNP